MGHEEPKLSRQTPETARSQTKEAILERIRSEDKDSFVVQAPPRRKFESIRQVFPRFIWEQVEYDIAVIEDAAPQELNPAKLEVIATALAGERYEREAQDKLTGLKTQTYVKEEMTDILSAQLRENLVNSFDHIVRIRMDINGLKAFNDYAGKHSSGDEYLKLVAKGLQSSATLENLRLHGSNIILAREYGDDFSVTIIGRPGKQIDTDEIITQLRQELANIEIPEKLLSQTELTERIGEPPKDFKLYPSAGIGVVTAEEILSQNMLQEKNIIAKDDSTKRVVQKIMGTMFDVSDERMEDDKEAFKEQLAHGTDAEQYYFKAISPRDQKLMSEIEILKEQIALQQKKINQLESTG